MGLSALNTANTTQGVISLCVATPTGKETTKEFKRVDLYSLDALMQLMNSKAITAGLFLNGYRNSNHLKAMGNVILLDVDDAAKIEDKYNYKVIEDALKDKNISFVSVPSQSGDLNRYKRHIAVILSDRLNHTAKSFKSFVEHFLNDVGIDKTLLDLNATKDRVRHFAPAAINPNFRNYDELSYCYEGNAYQVPKQYHPNQSSDDEFVSIDKDVMIEFSDGMKLPFELCKSIVSIGKKKRVLLPRSR